MMARFITELQVRLKKGSDSIWVLLAPLGYYSDITKCEIWVPIKFEVDDSNKIIADSLLGDKKSDDLFETDFASVPRLPLIYDLFGDRAHYESVIHDYLYCKDSFPVVEREVADKVFLEAMKLRGKSWFVRSMMYAGVRAGGWTAYHKRNVKDKI
jgi:hypothetical protein